MGSIVSSKKEGLQEPVGLQPSAVYAAEAKLRQEMMMTPNYEHFRGLVHKLQRKDAFDGGGSEEVLWYPAGVPLWYTITEDDIVSGVTNSDLGEPEYNSNWMNTMDGITTKELHHAAALIQRTIRSQSETESAQHAEEESAVKIQRSFRQFQKRQSEQQLLVKPYLPMYSLNNDSDDPPTATIITDSDDRVAIGQGHASNQSKNETQIKRATVQKVKPMGEDHMQYTAPLIASRTFRRSKSNDDTEVLRTWNRQTSYSGVGNSSQLTGSHNSPTRSLPSLTNSDSSLARGGGASDKTRRTLKSAGEVILSPRRSLPNLEPDSMLNQTHPLMSSSSKELVGMNSFGSLPSLTSAFSATQYGTSSGSRQSFSRHTDIRQLSRAPRSKERQHNVWRGGPSDPLCMDCFVQGTDYKKCMEKNKMKLEQVKNEKLSNCETTAAMSANSPKKPKRQRHSGITFSPCLASLNEEKSADFTADEEPPLDDSLIDLLYEEIEDGIMVNSNRRERKKVNFDHPSSADSFTPLLASINEDELLDEIDEGEPLEQNRTTAVHTSTTKLKRINTIIDMIYKDTVENDTPSKLSECESSVNLPETLVNKFQTAIIQRQLTRESLLMSSLTSDIYGKDSILIEPPDVKTLLKAAEFRGGVVRKLTHLTSSISLDYFKFMNEVEQITYYAAQQAEAALSDYIPQTVMLISSTVPKCALLRSSVKPGVLVHIYDFHSSLASLLDTVRQLLNNYKPGAKAKHIGIVCKGGPGYFYLVAGVPVTTVRLRRNPELLQFWQSLGCHMSKLIPGQSIMYFMESNVAGNRKGEKLLEDLEAAMFSNQVKVRAPIELAPSGRAMLEMYFDIRRHKLWKMMRYTKLRIY